MKRFIGDIHGNIEYLKGVLSPEIPNIQVGDFGFGFVKVPEMENLKFIRGNHDNPALCRESPMYLGDYGQWQNIFFVSGAYSVDYKYRTPELDWWFNEELSNKQLDSAIDQWGKSDARIFVSHEAPASITVGYLGFRPTRTTMALEAALERRKPDIWIFGHHHQDLRLRSGGVRFYGINKLSYLDI